MGEWKGPKARGLSSRCASIFRDPLPAALEAIHNVRPLQPQEPQPITNNGAMAVTQSKLRIAFPQKRESSGCALVDPLNITFYISVRTRFAYTAI